MAVTFFFNGPEDAAITILLAHGAGGAMDSASMTAISEALAAEGLRIARFEFGYMAARRSGIRKPPPRAETLIPEYKAAIDQLDAKGKLVIGGKSMGGRIASMIADELYTLEHDVIRKPLHTFRHHAPQHRIAGLLCLGYPFHPIGKPQQLRTAHLADMKTPTLIVQGTRDPFGTPDEVATYTLSPAIDILWLPDGDHDLKPRQRLSGFSAADHLRTMAGRVASWARELLSPA